MYEYPLEQAEKQNSAFAQHGDERKSTGGGTGEEQQNQGSGTLEYIFKLKI